MKNKLLLICLIIFISCEREKLTDIDIHHTSALVVTGFIGCDGKTSVYIQSSCSLFDPANDTNMTAFVNLINEADSMIQIPEISDNLFGLESSDIHLSGKPFRIIVSSPGFNTVSSHMEVVPSMIAIDSVTVDNNKFETYVTTWFKDPSGADYYAIRIEEYLEDGTYVQPDSEYKLVDPYSVFDDSGLDSESIHQKRIIYNRTWLNGNQVKVASAKIILFHLSSSAYYYFETLKESEYTSGDLMTDPTIIFSNINNGYGVFGAYASDTLTITIQK